MRRLSFVVVLLAAAAVALVQAGNQPIRARNGMVVSQNAIASQVGIDALEDGGTAIDAAVATAFALAVTHPTAGNIGGGGFLVHRAASGDAIAYDFRELAPAGASATMWFEDDEYSFQRHHMSHLSVGVPRARSPVCIWPGRSTARCPGGAWSIRRSRWRVTGFR